MGRAKKQIARPQNRPRPSPQLPSDLRAGSARSNRGMTLQPPQIPDFVQLAERNRLSLELDTEIRQRLPLQCARFPLDETRSAPKIGPADHGRGNSDPSQKAVKPPFRPFRKSKRPKQPLRPRAILRPSYPCMSNCSGCRVGSLFTSTFFPTSSSKSVSQRLPFAFRTFTVSGCTRSITSAFSKCFRILRISI